MTQCFISGNPSGSFARAAVSARPPTSPESRIPSRTAHLISQYMAQQLRTKAISSTPSPNIACRCASASIACVQFCISCFLSFLFNCFYFRPKGFLLRCNYVLFFHYPNH